MQRLHVKYSSLELTLPTLLKGRRGCLDRSALECLQCSCMVYLVVGIIQSNDFQIFLNCLAFLSNHVLHKKTLKVDKFEALA